jgi:transmembrane sensor
VTHRQNNIVELVDNPLTEAMQWRVRLAELGTETCLEFEVWLSNSANRAAWFRVNSVWQLFEQYASEPRLLTIRHSALGEAKRIRSNHFRSTHLKWLGGIAALIVLGFGISLGWYHWSQRVILYQTALGERRVVTLADGSIVSLDSGSELTIKYTRHSRELRLVKGQARFDVAHDVKRPFSVLAKDQKVIATGTAFNIDLTQQKVLVTLIEGNVVVVNEAENSEPHGERAVMAPVKLKAGQQLEEVDQRPPEITTANIEQATAWMRGQAIIDNDTLASLVAQVNHYSRTPIVIDDPHVAAMRISGVFNVSDQTAFLDVVTHYLPVRAVSTCSGNIRIESRND